MKSSCVLFSIFSYSRLTFYIYVAASYTSEKVGHFNGHVSKSAFASLNYVTAIVPEIVHGSVLLNTPSYDYYNGLLFYLFLKSGYISSSYDKGY